MVMFLMLKVGYLNGAVLVCLQMVRGGVGRDHWPTTLAFESIIDMSMVFPSLFFAVCSLLCVRLLMKVSKGKGKKKAKEIADLAHCFELHSGKLLGDKRNREGRLYFKVCSLFFLPFFFFFLALSYVLSSASSSFIFIHWCVLSRYFRVPEAWCASN